MGLIREAAARLFGLLALVCVLFGGRGAQAGPPSEPEAQLQEERSRMVWRPTTVAWPIAPVGEGREDAAVAAVLEARLAMQAGHVPVPSVVGVVELDGERAVGVWISALETVRVRQLGDPVPLRFVRGVDDRVAVVEPGRVVAAGPGGERRWELDQPPSRGAIWSIEADAPTRVLIERLEVRDPLFVAVEVEQDVLEWIAAGTPTEQMPALLEPANEVGARLRLHAALEQELRRLGSLDRKLERAIEAWRMLVAMSALDGQRTPLRPYFTHEPGRRAIVLEDTRPVDLGDVESRDYRLAELAGHSRIWKLAAAGPGQLHIAARAWAPVGAELAGAELQVRAGGRVIARLPLPGHPAQHAVDPAAALPQRVPLLTKAGEPVGEFEQLTVVLAPGRHDYELELVGGPALLSVERSRRTEATLAARRGWTPKKRAHAATRAIERSQAEAAPWLALLLSEQTLAPLPLRADDPRFDALAEQSPLLALASLAIAATDQQLDDRAMDSLVERVRPWLAKLAIDRSVEPVVRGHVRARWLALIANHGRADLAAALLESVPGGVEPFSELTVEGLRLAAELIGFTPTAQTERASVLALLQLAQALAPDDESLRAQLLRAWSRSSHWALLLPRPSAGGDDVAFGPRGEWLVPHNGLNEPSPADKLWLRLENGRPAQVLATLREADDTQARLRLLDIYVASPAGATEPVSLRVGDQRWWSPQLFGVQRHRLAVPAGVHELQFDGPAQTQAWASLPPPDPVDPSGYARRESLWSLPDSTWQIGGPPVPGFVRLRLRWPSDVPPRPVRITVLVGENGQQVDTGTQLLEPRTVVFDPRSGAKMDIDHDAVPMAGSPLVSPHHDLVIPVTAATTSLRFAVEGDVPILGSLSLRRGLRADDFADPAGPGHTEGATFDHLFGDLAELGDEAMLEELRSLSAELFAAPEQLDRRARRAALLLVLGETGLARADVLRLTAQIEREATSAASRAHGQRLLAELDVRFNALIEPRQIVVAPERGREVLLLEPAIMAVTADNRAALEPWLETWSRVRELPTDLAIADIEATLAAQRKRAADPASLLLGELARAHWLAIDPARAREAGRTWLELYGRMAGGPGSARQPIAVGIAAVAPLLQHLDDPTSDARDAGAAYGLALELIPHYSHTSIRQLAFIAAHRSDWNTIDHAEHSASFETLELPVSELLPSPSSVVRDALMVTPWTGNTDQQLRPGRKAVLAWDAQPGTMSVQLWCRAMRPDLVPMRGADPGHAKLTLRLRGGEHEDASVLVELPVEIGDGVLEIVEFPLALTARHRLEILLDSDPLWLCSWQAHARDVDPGVGLGEPLESHRRAMWWTLESKQSAEFVVLGPASLHVESRAIMTPDVEQRPLVLHARIDSSAEVGQLELGRRTERAVITERRRNFEVAHAVGHTLVLTEAVPYRVRLQTDRGRALVRLRVRRDRGDLAPPAQFSIREVQDPRTEPDETATPRSHGLTTRVAGIDPPAPVRNRFGTVDAFVRVGLDELDDSDTYRVRFGSLVTVGWRRELIEDVLWLRLAAQTQIREHSPPAAGGILGLGAVVPVIGLRLGAGLNVLAHSFAGRVEASARATGFIDRPTWIGRFVQLRPRLEIGWRGQSLNSDKLAAAAMLTPLEPHPNVYLRYIEAHPWLIRPELGLRVFPFQDLALSTRASLVPNTRSRGLDHVDLDVGLDGIGRRPQPWVPIWGLSYQASFRFQDLDRSPFELRHRIDGDLGVGVWADDVARVALGVSDQVYLSTVTPIRNVFEVWLRVDAALGRRMRDYSPSDTWFGELWAPRGWGNDEHQARSTRGRIPTPPE
jgi:hypothetical protein